MAVGKNKKLGKKAKVAGKKKAADPFSRKEWYDIKAPAMFVNRVAGKTPVNRTAGTKVASESLKGRVFTVSLADLNGAEDMDYRKIKLVGEEVQGKALLTNFYGMDITRDKLCGLIKKWQTLIEARADVTTTDGYKLRLFAIAFTKRRPNQVAKTSYAQSAQIRAIRKKMIEVMTTEANKSDLKGLVNKFIPEALSKQIEKACNGIYPLQNVFIRKVKTLKMPRFDIVKLMELHEGSAGDAGVAVKAAEEPIVAPMEGAGGRL
jgi:small subunit ribosomal protein S3Ae